MDVNSVSPKGLENGPNFVMALQSSTPFGAVENGIPKGKPLFSSDSDRPSDFSFPYSSAGQYGAVFNSSAANHITSTPTDPSKAFGLRFPGDYAMNHSNIELMDSDSASDSGPAPKSESGASGAGDNNNMEDQSDQEEEPVECGNCDNEFLTLQEYMDHTCSVNKKDEEKKNEATSSKLADEQLLQTGQVLSDVESFDGKIVYNPDGSAYIIEGDSDSDLDSIIDLPKKEGVIIDSKNDVPSQQPIPQIDNAFFVPRNPSTVLTGVYMIPHKHQAPIMHSYRVYDLRSGKHKPQISGESVDSSASSKSAPSHPPPESSSTSEPFSSSLPRSSSPSSSSAVISVPTKPILMCFICKLSFGFAKSFMTHAVTEHSMSMSREEKDIMSQKHSSAIIQGIGKDKDPLMSFLEPILASSSEVSSCKSPPCQEPASDSVSALGKAKDTTSVSYVYAKPKLSDSIASVSPSQTKSLSDSGNRGLSRSPSATGSPGNSLKTALSTKPYSFEHPESLERRSEEMKVKTEPQDLENESALKLDSGLHLNHMSRFMQEDMGTSPGSSLDVKSSIPVSGKPLMSSLATHLSPSQGRPGFYGACEEHPHGRAQGVECPNCDMVLSSSQSLGGHMTMMHSRNSCKTLKCPKCNWHYKYQETLEIHMKEKHPDSDQKCVYCLTNQSHPRLARGESYSCGYKPYRCEVCNYSTTTKGNLSIHMQSDKHLNNVQELANGGGEMKLPPQPPPPPPPHETPPQRPPSHTPPHSSQQPPSDNSQAKKNKPKPTWRCDVCNYETNVARNLRIHMTSEKHTHNMMVLQQNMKHMQRDMQLHQMNQIMMLQQDPSFLGLSGPIPGGVTFPYDGSLMMGGIPAGFGEAPMDLTKENGLVGPGGEHELPDVSRLYQCCVCNIYGTDSLESLHQHLQHDRTKQRENENIMVSSGTYMCNLCTYKTNLKANFQLHCKTDKHLQRLQLVNHIKEGGANNEWRLKYLNVSNPVQVRCNACDYYTNSIHKLQIHTGNPRHEASAQLFCHLLTEEVKVASKDKYYQCTLCKFNARSKLGLMQHVHSMQHLHSENLKQLQMKEQGQLEVDIGEIFTVLEISDPSIVKFDDEDGEGDEDGSASHQGLIQDPRDPKTDSTAPTPPTLNNNTIKDTTTDDPTPGDGPGAEQLHTCQFCTFSSVNEMRIQEHVLSQHPQQPKHATCPLCQDSFWEKPKLERHLITVHNVTPEGLQKLLLLVDDSVWNMPPTSAKESPTPSPTVPTLTEIGEINLDALEAEAARLAVEDAIDLAQSCDKDGDDQFRCQTCSKTFSNIDSLYAHQNELGHLELKQTPRGPGYLCWKKGCNQYFKTAQALQIHFREIHAKRMSLSASDRSVYKYPCSQCSLAFKSPDKLQLHGHFHLIKSTLACNFCTKTFSSIAALKKHVELTHDLSDSQLEQYNAAVMANAAALPAIIGTSGLNKLLACSSSDISMKSNTSSAHQGNGKEFKDSMKMDVTAENSDDDGLDSADSSKHNSASSTPALQENGIERGVSGSVEERGEINDALEKEQQFFEDYINSQAFAEGSYEDPSRKYKCHRCKVAFTKQNYLTAHNKTLMHRKGDRLSYPLERYLDPNRPFKCDVCKESFTQKNILLVHYNSVSHLHKVKQASQGAVPSSSSSPSPLGGASSSPVPQSQQAAPQPSNTSTLSTATSASSAVDKNANVNAKRTLEYEDDSMRPYKCNICKVAYSQGSTLDIHIRSVAHQTKTSKLQELALSGEVDLTRPLIEEPTDPHKAAAAQQQKLIADILSKQTSIAMSQPSLLFPGMSGGLPVPGLPSLPVLSLPPALTSSLPSKVYSTATSGSSQSSHNYSMPQSSTKTTPSTSHPESSGRSLEKISQQLMMSQSQKFSHAGESISAAQATQSWVNSNVVSPQQGILSGSIHVCQRCSAVFASQESYIQHQMFCSGNVGSPLTSSSSNNQSSGQSRQRTFIGRVKPQVHRNLLENIGFECVMQFNEFNQPSSSRGDSSATEDTSGNPGSDEDKVSNPGNPGNEGEEKERNPGKHEEADAKDETKTLPVDLPEMNKCVCSECSKEFSSVWVLKAHQEEVHKDIVPIERVIDAGDQFKSDFEKKLPKEPEISVTASNPSIAEEVHVKQEMPPPPPPPPQPQVDMLQMMNMFGMMPMPLPLTMMNMQPSLMPMMLHPGMEQSMKSPIPSIDSASNALTAQQKQLQQAAMQNQKRARTRINDEQLKILRGCFDINNSPSEEQIQQMSDQAGLPTKVIKHWFRNTLFKERQRNKDSPYNFNNPPSTTLDLEEYEKTGKIPVVDSPPVPEIQVKKEIAEPNPGPSEVKMEVEHKVAAPIRPPRNPSPKPERESTPKSVCPPVMNPVAPTLPVSTSNTFSTDVNESLDLENFANLSQTMSSKHLSSSMPTTPLYENHNYSPPGGSSGRRANRTRFTDYQIKVLQEYFEQNAYPKDDELDHLSKLLNLSPRVIVVWFQNARQKARKIYENQPQSDGSGKEGSTSSGTPSYNRTPGLNYQCKKCQAVFQRYYDLIRHQKRQCFTESEKMDSHMMSDDSDSLSHVTSLDDTYLSDQESETSSNVSKPTHNPKEPAPVSEAPSYKCEKCNLSFHRLELWREHQNVHSMNPGLFLNLQANSAFGVLQNMAAAQHQQQMQEDKPVLKRKFEEDREDDMDQPRDKRLRTTILPEQLDYLYQKYQIDCNPSRKQLESISKDVGLKKRVVQVWFQNTRARERKGQYRAHQQLIHKRCPICRALFRAKSALESHLATKHPDEMAKGEINVDAIPDAAIESPSTSTSQASSSSMLSPSPDFSKLLHVPPPGMQGLLPLLPPVSLAGMGFPPMADPIQMSMKQFYEDSFKKYINELSSTSPAPPQKGSHTSTATSSSSLHAPEFTSTPIKAESTATSADDLDAPLDLSKPLKISTDHDRSLHEGPATNRSGRSSVEHSFQRQYSHNESLPGNPSLEDDSSNLSSNPTSPGTPHSHLAPQKRYRTQMTSLQVRIMKHIFAEYKTPTMAECEMLGRVIGLQKRVVQVWFQNARAKEKKAKLNMAKTFGPQDMDFPKPPEECSLCNFKYSHKYTIQDHIFTKKHIDKVKEFIQSQSDAERELSNSSGSISGVSGVMRSQQPSDLETMRKAMEEASASQSQMAQLQSMGLGPFNMPPGSLSGVNPMLNPIDLFPEMKKESGSSHREKEKKEEKKSEGAGKKEPVISTADAAQLQGLNFFSPFGGFLPGMEPSVLPYMYPSMPGVFPGMGMPLLPPGLMPGTEHLLGYDPMTYGTPLPMLQIPPQAIKDVSSKLMDPKASVGQYTQDCKSISSLRSLVASADYSCAREATVDVGYICKKCQMVYPARDACVSHQRMICFPGGKLPEGINPILKLEQIQYECRLCSDKSSSVQEFKNHCQQESHKSKVSKYQQQKASLGSSSSGGHKPSSATATLSSAPASDNKEQEVHKPSAQGQLAASMESRPAADAETVRGTTEQKSPKAD